VKQGDRRLATGVSAESNQTKSISSTKLVKSLAKFEAPEIAQAGLTPNP
jgi:hypothetical protein